MSKHFTRLMWRKGNKQTNKKKKRVFLLQLIVCSGHFGFRAFLILVGTYHARVIRVTSPPCYWDCVLWCLHDIHFCRMADLERERERGTGLLMAWRSTQMVSRKESWRGGGEKERERTKERERRKCVLLVGTKAHDTQLKKMKKEEGEDEERTAKVKLFSYF